MTKFTIARIKKEWVPPIPISSVIALFIHYLTYKVLIIFLVTAIPNIYDYIDFWGTHFITDNSLIVLVFYIHILLICYIMVEAWSDWPLFPRFRTIIIYSITMLITLQGLIGLDVIRRFSPYNPQQTHNIYFLQDAILKNDFNEVKRLIAGRDNPFAFSTGNRELLPDYKWLFPVYWAYIRTWRNMEDPLFIYPTPSLFALASANATKNITPWAALELREDYKHPRKQTILPFDPRIFDYLLSLKPSEQELQKAIIHITFQGNKDALIRLLDYDKKLIPSIVNIERSVRLCFIDISEILLKRLFDRSQYPHETKAQLANELGNLSNEYSPCTAPLREILNSERYSLP